MERRILLAMPTLWTTDGPGGGGALYGAVIAPNGQDLWVTSDMSGIYHSRDLGQSWQMLNYHSSVGGVNGGSSTKIQFTSDPNTLYITNTSLNVAKSTDGGVTWAALSGWSAGTGYWIGTDLSTTTKILVSNGSNLYLSTNGGTSFSTAYTSSNLYVAGAFFDGSNVYVGTNQGLLISSNGGASFSLAAQQPGQTIMSFTGAKQGSTVRLLVLTTGDATAPDSDPEYLTYGGAYRLDVGGSWVNISSGIAAVPSGGDMHYISMAQNNISIVYTGGGDPVGAPQVFKSSDGGTTWADVFYALPTDVTPNVPNANTATGYEGYHGDLGWWWGGSASGFSVCPTDANKAIVAQNFTQLTTDGGTSWRQTYENPGDSNPAGADTPLHKAYRGIGLTETSVHYLTWTSPTNIFASYTDIDGWRSTDGGASWSHPNYNGVVSNTLYNTVYSGGNLYGATSNVHDMYVSTHLLDSSTNPSWQTGAVVVSADQGANWSNIHSFGAPVVWIQIDPNNANRMYAMVVDGIGSGDAGANGGVWVTSNLNLGASSTWTKLANPPRTQGHPYILKVLNDGTLVATYSGRRAGSPQVFTDSSGVFISTNGGASWIDRSAANMHWYTKEITIDPTDPTQNTWYVGVFNGWSGTGNDLGDLYRTTDRGLTWTKMNLGSVIPTVYGSLSVQSVTINAATKEMYVTTEGYGMLYAPDVTVAGFSASNFSDVPSFPFGTTERVFINPYNSQDVWVASFGGGIVRGGVAPSTLAATTVSSTQINLTWSDNSTNETGFAIDRATDSGFTQNLVTTTAAMNATSASITGLSSGTPYYFRVRATNGFNKSANSSSASATTLSGSNQAPTDIALSSTSIPENQSVGTAVGTLSSTDPDAGNTFTYSLVSGTGSTDNASFTISGSTLQTAAIFNYEAKNSYSIRLRTTDQGGLWFEKTFTISVTNVNETPTDITLSTSSVAENQSVGTAVGTLSTTDPDVGNTFTYSLVSGTGSTDNASFTISGSTLQTAAIFNYEAKSSYSIRLRTTDQGGLWFEKTFTISVTNVNETPTDITLSASSVAENQSVGTAVGTLGTADPDAGNTFTYSLVSGTGSTDNTSFSISGSTLQTAAIFNYEAKNSYSIRLRTTDQGGLWFEKTFTISVTNVNETPTDITLSASSVAENQSVGTAVGTLGTADPDAGNTFTYSLVSGTGSTDNASFAIAGNTLQTAAIFNFEAKSSYSIRVRTTDQGGLWFEKTFTISVLNVAEVAPTITGISTDTGSSSSDGITSDPTLLINGTSEPGMTITVYRGGVLAGTTSANGSGNWTFDYTGTSLADGSYSFTATASDTLGHTTAASAPYAVTIDTAAPTVTGVYVMGSTWTSGFLSFLAGNLSGSSSTYGFAIPVGTGTTQLETLPWRNLDRISVRFSEDVSVAQAQFAIVGSVGSYSVSGFSYNSTDHVATWSLSAVIGPDKLYIALPGSGATPVTDVAGNVLDGEWTNPTSFDQVGATSIFPSGNGVAGGDFAFRFDVLPGDSTGGSLGKVNVADINQTKSRSSLPETTSSYRSDFDGNGLVNVADINYVKSKSSIYSLPVNPPVLPVFSSVSLLLTQDGSLLA